MRSPSAPAKNPADDPIQKAMHTRRQRAADRRGWLSLGGRVLLVAVALWVVLGQIFLVTSASGSDMFPAVKDGDLVIANRLATEYSKNDVVVYTADGAQRVGRIIARAGDVVTMDDSGTLLVNGTVQTGEILFSTYAKEGIDYPFTVPEDCVFILCDYRTSGIDSRDFGAVPLEDVAGKVITILRRRSI